MTPHPSRYQSLHPTRGGPKSYLAEIMALRWARNGWQVVDMVRDLDASWQALRPDDSRQLFVFSDPLGEADLAPTAIEDAHGIRSFMDAIVRRSEDNKRLIVTSPTEVMRRAALSAGNSLRSLAEDVRGRCELTLDDWDEPIRIRALLNHLHFAGLTSEELRAVQLDRRTVSVVRHPSFNPRLIEKICDQLTGATTSDEALAKLLDALALPETVWSVSWATLGELATEVVLTLATLRPRPVLLSELRKLAAKPGMAAREWQEGWRSLEPIWITTGGPATNRSVMLADPSLRDFLLGTLEDSDMTDERLDRAATLEQLGELSRAAGDLTADVPVAPLVTRPVIAHVLAQRRSEVAEQVRGYTDVELPSASTGSALRTLSLAAALLGIYGEPDAVTWVAERVSGVLAGNAETPPLEGLALAARVRGMPDGRARDELLVMIITAATTNVRSLSDLDAFESYADAWNWIRPSSLLRQSASSELSSTTFSTSRILRPSGQERANS
ncbi:hypothetical protein [Spirillospora sp. NPDC047279]|uniref:nSTAND3 domain-containing NTPase n=1 Tax=Spirillospora sp. NPDC047279 TaxID=3155478 RepID=UPI0033CDA58A